MNQINNNPFRTLGLLSGSSAREINRQASRLQKIIVAEQEPPVDDYSFHVLGNLTRTAEKIEEAVSKLNLDSDKMHAALFWFWKGSDITDEPAFEAIKSGEIKTAIDIWTKLTLTGETAIRSAAAAQNLSTLLLSSAKMNCKTDRKILETAIRLKLQFIEKEYFDEFKNQVTDSVYKVDKKDFQLMFLDSLIDEYSKYDSKNISSLFKIINEIDFSAESLFRDRFIRKITDKLSLSIEKAKRREKQDNELATGNALYLQTCTELNLLKSIVGGNNITYISYADRVADEMLNCAIDNFNRGVNADKQQAAELCRKGQALALGSAVKQRYEHEVAVMQTPFAKERLKVQSQLIYINTIMQSTSHYTHVPDLILQVAPYLALIKIMSGYDLYVQISSEVAQFASSIVIENWNTIIRYENKTELKHAWKIFKKIQNMDMNEVTEKIYMENKYIMKQVIHEVSNTAYTVLWIIAVAVCVYILHSDELPNKMIFGVIFFASIIHRIIRKL